MGNFTTHISLLQRLSTGADAEAWQEFHDRYGLLIRGMARRQGLQEADCDEVVQDVLTALTQSMPEFTYDPAKGMFRAYLKTITLRKVFAQQRKRAEFHVPEDELHAVSKDPSIEAMWEAEWRQYHLRQALRTVEPEFNAVDRAAFQAYAVGGQSASAVAEQLGVSLDQVYQAKSRMLRRLEHVIARQVVEEG